MIKRIAEKLRSLSGDIIHLKRNSSRMRRFDEPCLGFCDKYIYNIYYIYMYMYIKVYRYVFRKNDADAQFVHFFSSFGVN